MTDLTRIKDQVKSRLDIVDLVQETVTLKKSGNSYTGFCPFHNNTKTEALAIFPETNTWHCFGSCGDGGDVFSWVMKRDNIDFKAALSLLAQKANVTLSPNGQHPNGHDPGSKRAYKGLADYAQAHGVDPAIFAAAGWSETTHQRRPALVIKTDTGPRYRFTDDKDPVYIHGKGYRRCWYKLAQAVEIAKIGNVPLIICNGEASTVVGQHYGLAAVTLTSGSEKPTIPKTLLEELKAAYTGPIVVALDCDTAGRANAPKLAQFLTRAGYKAHAVDLALGNTGQDLADFCKLHQSQAAAQIGKLKLAPKETNKIPGRPKSEEYLAVLSKLGYSFRMNDLDDTLEVNGIPLTDPVESEIRVKMWDLGYTKYHSFIADTYTAHAKNNPYHPIKNYLESLTYDGGAYIDTLATYFKDQQNIFLLWLKKWLVGAVSKVYTQSQNPMLVLDGAQGKGKSYFSAWLCPLTKHFVESAIQPENVDHKLLLATTWIWEVGELGATTRKADREALKSFITLGDITARKPYGRRPIQKPAMASFIGTVNDEAGFLNDPTGSRRFLTCTLTSIDWAYTQIDVNKIWAEAFHLYKNGYKWRLSAQDRALQKEINEHYEVDDPLIAEILRNYEIIGGYDTWTASRDILIQIGLDPLNRGNTMRLSQAFKKLEVEKGKQGPPNRRVNGFFGLQLAPPEKPETPPHI